MQGGSVEPCISRASSTPAHISKTYWPTTPLVAWDKVRGWLAFENQYATVEAGAREIEPSND